MRKLAWWFCMFGMTLRRALYRPVFLLFLLIFPLGMGALHQVENGIPGGSRWRSARERMRGIRRLQKDWNRKRAVHFSFIRAGRRKRQRRRL